MAQDNFGSVCGVCGAARLPRRDDFSKWHGMHASMSDEIVQERDTLVEARQPPSEFESAACCPARPCPYADRSLPIT